MIKYLSQTLKYLLVCLCLAGTPSAWAQSLIRDAEIENTLRDFTDPILEVAGLNPGDVQIYIINDPSLNAFVAFGQRIHLHTGLILAAENAGQLKGVIAHETAHIASGHTITRTQAAQAASRPALVSIGLGLIAIAAGAPDAGAALLASSQQFAALTFFTHTRAEEASADQSALTYMEALGQSPAGLLEFFENYRYQEVFSEARRFPYFRSHPLSSDRIQSLRVRAERTGLMDVQEDPDVVFKMDMMQAKLYGFLEVPQRVYQRYPFEDKSPPARYARAIAAFLTADVKAALTEIDALIESDPDNPYFYELRGQILFENARTDESIAPNEKAVELAPREPLLLVNLARSLIVRGDTEDLTRAENLLLDALFLEKNNGFAWAQLAIVFEKQGRRAEAELATAEQAFHLGNYQRAFAFAQRAMSDLPPGTPEARRASDILAITDPRLRTDFRRSRRGLVPLNAH